MTTIMLTSKLKGYKYPLLNPCLPRVSCLLSRVAIKFPLMPADTVICGTLYLSPYL